MVDRYTEMYQVQQTFKNGVWLQGRVKFPWQSTQLPGLGSLLPWLGAMEHSWEVYPVCTSPVHLGFPALILGLWIGLASTRSPLHHDCYPEISPTAVHLDTQIQYSASQLLHIIQPLLLRLHSASYTPVALHSWCGSIIPTPLIPTQHPVTNSLTSHLLLSLAHTHTYKFLPSCCKGQIGNHLLNDLCLESNDNI